jgi:hypothetical protein
LKIGVGVRLLYRLIWLQIWLLICASCARPAGPTVTVPPTGDPLALGEKPLRVDQLPGDPPLRWPFGAIWSGGAWLLPWHDAGGWHVRRVSSGGESDRPLSGELQALLPLGRGFAAVTPDSVRFVDEDGATTATFSAAAGKSASDGHSVLIAAQDSALLLSTSEQLSFALPEAPSNVFGDAGGFVVGNYLVSPTGELARAPAPLFSSTRLYRQPQAGGDWVSLDASTWVEAGGTLTWASPDGATAMVDGHIVLGLDERGMRTRGLLPRSVLATSSWLTAKMGHRLVWEAVVDPVERSSLVEDERSPLVERSSPVVERSSPVVERSSLVADRALVLLDAGSLVATGGWVRIPEPFSRTVLVVPGDSALLLAWLAADHLVRYAVWTPEKE